MTVVIAHPSLAGTMRGRHARWVYADDDQELYWWVEQKLGGASGRLVAPEAFHERTAELRRPFVEWVDRCLADAAPQEHLTTPLYKNPYDNPMFLHVCWLSLINEHLRQGAHGILIFSESSGFARAVEHLCLHHGVPCSVTSRARLALSRAWRNATALAALVLRLLELAARIYAARAVLGNSYREKLKDVKVLVDTYLLDSDLTVDGRFQHRYLPGLLEWYGRQGLRTGSFPLPYQVPRRRIVSLFRRMKRSNTLFVPFELYATGADLWWATWHALRQARAPVRARPTPAMPIDAQPIAEWHRAATAMRAFLALVLLRIPMRLRSAGMEPAWLVEWYEGQPIDKACHVGFASIGSRCRVIAARQYAPLPNYLSLYTTSSEVEAGAAPRENWVCGPAERTDMAAYDSVGDYRVVPALRYAHLHRPESESPAEKDLLVLLPYSRQDARQILKCLLPALDGMKDHFRTVIIKAHHTMATELATDGIGRYPDGLEAPTVIWSDSPLPVLLPGARIVVTTNTSAALEALCRARPVIVVGRTAGLTNNPLENADRRMWQLAYDPVGLRQAVENWSPCHPLSLEERLALGTVIRDAYFEPTSEETMQAFLPHLDRIR